MLCQRCNSNRLFRFYAKHNDLFVYTYKDQKEVEDYAPHIDNLCGGDDTQATICLECGQVQGMWPVEFEGKEIDEEEQARLDEEEEFERAYHTRMAAKQR